MKKLMFVCTGNTCRSSMAEAIARKLITEEGLNNSWQVSSAGLAAIDNQGASPKAVEVLREMGLDLSGHLSKSIPSNIGEYDLVLTMTKMHKDFLIKQYGLDEDKVFLLNEFAFCEDQDILDPYGASKDIYHKTALELQESIKQVIEKLKV